MDTLNLKFADGNKLISYNDDQSFTLGCETCNYGSRYINDIDIYTTHYHINIRFCQMYEFAFTTVDAIALFAVDIRGMTEDDFISYIDKRIHAYYDDDVLEEYTVIRRE